MMNYSVPLGGLGEIVGLLAPPSVMCLLYALRTLVEHIGIYRGTALPLATGM